MWIAELMIALLFGLVLAGILGLALGSAVLGGFLWLFAVIFLGAWAVGAWVAPVGPLFLGVAWLPFLLGAVAVALLVAAHPRRRTVTPPDAAGATEAETALGGFFWAFVVTMLVVIALGSL